MLMLLHSANQNVQELLHAVTWAGISVYRPRSTDKYAMVYVMETVLEIAFQMHLRSLAKVVRVVNY